MSSLCAYVNMYKFTSTLVLFLCPFLSNLKKLNSSQRTEYKPKNALGHNEAKSEIMFFLFSLLLLEFY